MKYCSEKVNEITLSEVLFIISIMFSTVTVTAVVIFAALFISKNAAAFYRAAMLISFSLFVLSLVIILSLLLRFSVKKTIYSYHNILYTGGILYLALQFIYLAVYVINGYIFGGSASAKAFIVLIADFPRMFSYIAFPFLVIICLAVSISNLSLIRHEGFRVTNLLGFFLGGFYLGSTLLLYRASEFIHSDLLSAFGITEGVLYITVGTVIPLLCILVLCYFECFFFGCIIMGYAAARHIPRYDKDYIIILGCSVSKKGGLLPLLKGRTNRAVRFAWEQEIATGKKVCYVPSGGQGKNEIISEGSAIELYLLSHGAEANEVYPEKNSTDTFENMKFSKAVIDGIGNDAEIAFATTNYHVFRSGIIARRAGFDAEGVASSTKWYFWPNGFVREFIALLVMNKKVHAVAVLLALIFCSGVEALMLFGIIA